MINSNWRCLFVVAGIAAMTACSGGDEQAVAPAPAAASHETNVGSLVSPAPGAEVYARSCAVCHDSGVAGAPAIGDQTAWEARSRLWTAVLSEHAKSGYLGMPTKGGDASLSEADVVAASEYMLSETFPELPRSD